jgi:hypothetical protein
MAEADLCDAYVERTVEHRSSTAPLPPPGANAIPVELASAFPEAYPIPADPEAAALALAQLGRLLALARDITTQANAALGRRDYAGAARLHAEWQHVAAHGQRLAAAIYHPAAARPGPRVDDPRGRGGQLARSLH